MNLIYFQKHVNGDSFKLPSVVWLIGGRENPGRLQSQPDVKEGLCRIVRENDYFLDKGLEY